jgi:hypothetical protein
MTDELVLNRYRIIERVGRGGNGEVFRAEDTLMNRTVAVKRIELNDKTSARAINEARAAASLNHPNVVTMFDLAEDEHFRYLIMEFIDGVPLSRVLRAKSPLTVEESLDVAIQIADALEAAHSMEIVHRDIKPDNIMVTRDGNIKVTDFGIAKLGASDMTAEGDILGTFAYMSPEQARGGRIDSRTDIFSLGVILYEMLGGVSPFGSATPAGIVYKITTLEPRRLSELNETVGPDLESLIARALEKKRTDRLDDVTILRHYLESMRTAKTPTRKVIKGLYKAASGTEEAPVREYDGPFKEVFGAVSDVKEAVAGFLLSHRGLTERFANAAVAAVMLTFFLTKTGFYAGEITALIPFVYFGAALLFPRIGLAAGFAVICLPIADYSLIVAVFAAIAIFLWLLSFWLGRPAKTVFAFLAPLGVMGGTGLSFPLATGLLWKPTDAGLIAFLGGLGVTFFDLFNSKTIHFITAQNKFGLEKALSGQLNPIAAFSDLFKPFTHSPILLAQPVLWAAVAIGISLFAKRRSLRSDLYALAAGAAALLVGQLALMTIFHWNAANIDNLLKTFIASLILPIGLAFILPRRSFSAEDTEDDEDEEDDE